MTLTIVLGQVLCLFLHIRTLKLRDNSVVIFPKDLTAYKKLISFFFSSYLSNSWDYDYALWKELRNSENTVDPHKGSSHSFIGNDTRRPRSLHGERSASVV